MRGIDWREAASVLMNVSWPYALLALAAKIAALLIATFRWQFFTADLGLPLTFRQLWHANLVFNGVNQLVPSTIGGEFARYNWLAKGLSRRQLILSLVLDKASMYLLTIAAGLFVLLEFLPVWAGQHPWLADGLAVLSPGTEMSAADFHRLGRGLLAAIVGLAIAAMVAMCLWGPKDDQGQSKAERFLGFHRLWRHQLISLGFLLSLTLCFFCCLRATGLEISLGRCAMVFALMAAIGLVPVSISGFGLREASAVTLLKPFYGPFYDPLTSQDHIILAGSLLFGMLALCTSLPGLVMLWNRPKQPAPTGVHPK